MTAIEKRTKKHENYWPFFIMMSPGLLYLLINNYLPMIGIFIAFKKLDYGLGLWKSPWVGFKNFEFLFTTTDAWIITRNTLLYNIVFIVLSLLLGVILAIFFNELKNLFLSKTYQTILLLPQIISMVIVSYLVYAFLSADTGFINKSILNAFGKESISWYQDQTYWPFILTIVFLWKQLGFSMIIFLSSIVGIPNDYYEAGMLDGATRWQNIRHITLPCLKPTIMMLFLLNVGRIFYSDFGLFYQVPMNSGMLFEVTSTIDTYVYRGLMVLNDISMSSAAGVYQSICGFVLVMLSNHVTKKLDADSALF